MQLCLHFARGDLLVIFDAEDRPHPSQLREAARIFAATDHKLACLQARLNYHNHDENWLTQQFTLEYSVWFRLVLPGLKDLRFPVPLGGTSNHFRIGALRQLGAWDAFNVTEDADLGMRLSAHGLACGILPSTTEEEANCKLGNWLRQRSRWQKGFLQTYLTHMRTPLHFAKQAGWRGLLSLQLVIAGSLFAGLAPLVFLLSGLLIALGADDPTYRVTLETLMSANSVLFVLTLAITGLAAWVGSKRAGKPVSLITLVTMPAYWALIFLGAMKGLYQYIFKPFYWEKTAHGLSKSLGEHSASPVNAKPSAEPIAVHSKQ